MRGDKGPKFGEMIDAGTKIKRMFQRDLQLKKFDGITPNTPTQAAIEGKVFYGRTVINKRSGKAGKKLIPNRASFIYSTTMESSLRVWFSDAEGRWAPRDPPE
jgi:hypothetical protein